jgi:23S rRNA (adenine2503-C2)-methyltransferase
MKQSQPTITLIDRKNSKLDTTQKYVFDLQGQEVEFSFIHKNDGKDIIVCPCQTSCKMGCTFCFLTGMNLPVVNLTAEDIASGVEQVIREAKLPQDKKLLVSFMGSGEPLLNYKHILEACHQIHFQHVMRKYDTVSYAVATMMPSEALMREFTRAFRNFPMKLHLSLHSPFDDVRRKMMPQAVNVKTSLTLLREFQKSQGMSPKAIEIHYTLIDGFNDRVEDKQEIINLWGQIAKEDTQAGAWGGGFPKETTIKFLDFKARPDAEMQGSHRVSEFRAALEKAGISTEFYNPPGSDIGSSCGQFVRNKATSCAG